MNSALHALSDGNRREPDGTGGDSYNLPLTRPLTSGPVIGQLAQNTQQGSVVMNTNTNRRQRGFTLIELIVSIAILGVLAAIAVPSVLSFLNKGTTEALNADAKIIQDAVDTFRSEKHKAPVSGVWGAGVAQRLYPTKTGLVADLELGTQTDSAFTDRSNYRVKVYAAGPNSGADASDQNVEDGAIWIGLLVNEAAADVSTENQFPGTAHPQANETDEYLLKFPASASEYNTDTDATDNNTNGKTNGTYTWVILHNGQVVPTYKKAADSKWYAGSNDTYP